MEHPAPENHKPQNTEVMLLAAIQIGMSMVGSMILALLRLPPDASGPISAVALVIGAQIYVAQAHKRSPGCMYEEKVKPLALYGAAVHVAIGVLFLVMTPLPEELRGANFFMMTVLFLPLAGGIAYGLTRWGLRRGLRSITPPENSQ